MPKNDQYRETYVTSPSVMTTSAYDAFPSMLLNSEVSYTSIPQDQTVVTDQVNKTKLLVGGRRVIVQLGTPLTARISSIGMSNLKGYTEGSQLTGYYSPNDSFYILMEHTDKIIFSLSKHKLRIFIVSTTGQIQNITHYPDVLHELLDTHLKIYVYNEGIYLCDGAASFYSTSSTSGKFYDNNSPMIHLLMHIINELYMMSIKLNYNMPLESFLTDDKIYLALSLLKSPLMRYVYKPWLLGEGYTTGIMNKLISSTNLKRDLKKYLGRNNPEFMRIFFKNIRLDNVMIEKIAQDVKVENREAILNSALQYGIGYKYRLEQTNDHIKWVMNTSINIDRFRCVMWVNELFDSIDYQHKFIDSLTSNTDVINKPEDNVIKYLTQFTEKKRWRLITDENDLKNHDHRYGNQTHYAIRHNLDYLGDALHQLKQYETPESIPDTLKSKWPEGFKEPDKWGTIKELHDKISASYREIAAEANNKPIKYTEEWLKLDNIELDGFTIKLPHETKTLVYWGYTLNHCIATYADKAENGYEILFGVYKGEDLIWNGRLDAKYYSLKELRGYNNATDEKSIAYESIILLKMKELGFLMPKNILYGKIANQQDALPVFVHHHAPIPHAD